MFDIRKSARQGTVGTSTRYAQVVTVLSAADVAAELKRRLPGLPVKKQHKLLYYCQGHHAATFGQPLFAETISAWDMGPVVGQLWHQEREGTATPSTTQLTEAQLNTIGYVVSRYGGLTGADLERLTHAEPPWQDADRNRRPKSSAKIPVEALQAYFSSRDADDEEDDDAPLPDSEAVTAWLAQVTEASTDGTPDTIESLRARLTGA